MANLQEMDQEIAQLATDIGLSLPKLHQLVQKDERYIGQLVSLGRNRDFAEKASSIGDLRNILGLMRSHGFSAHTAARVIGQTPENPVEISTTEDEEEEEIEDQHEEEPQPDHNTSQDEDSVYPGSSASSCVKSPSVTSSDEDVVEAKRLRLDPDYRPSETSGETTPATTTASNSQLPSDEEEEELETTETEEEDTLVPNDTTEEDEEEIEVAEQEEEEL
jgi:hypothetical protein